MPSVVHTVSCVIFSFIFHGAKVIAHRRTTVALPGSFLSASFYLPLRAPQCLRQSSAEVASFVLSLLPCKLCWVISQYSRSRGNSDFCYCSEAGKHPSLAVLLVKTTTALSVLSQPIARMPHVAAKVITGNASARWQPSVTWVLNTIVFLFCWLYSHFIPPKQLEADISPVLAQH